MSHTAPHPDLLPLTAFIVASYVSHNMLLVERLPNVIRSVYAALDGATASPNTEVRAEPAVPVKRSIFPDYIVCLEDGRKMKTLKRHLRLAYGLTPQAYRVKWGLPDGYPMVAPNYAARRSALAKQIGLGRHRSAAPEAPPAREGVRGRRGARKPAA